MELIGAIDGINAVPDGTSVAVITDSDYVVKHMVEGQKINKNKDLWLLMDEAIDRKAKVKFAHVYGHGKGDTEESRMNNRCDDLVWEAREKLDPVEDEGYQKS